MLDSYKAFEFPVPTNIDWFALAPILAVVVTGILALLAEVIAHRRSNKGTVAVSLIGLVVAGVLAFLQVGKGDTTTLAGMFCRDRFGSVMQFLLVVTCFLAVLFSEKYLREKRAPFGEFYPLILWSTSGAMLMVTTHNLLVIFLGLEILSISLYVMAGLSRTENKSEESALKYLLLGAFASGFFLYGIAFIYGASGTLDLEGITNGFTDDSLRGLTVAGLALMMIGLFFKSAMVPFHQWTPDVYQGAPTNVTAFMAVGSKIAAIATLIRVLEASGALEAYWQPVVYTVAILTMTVGNLAALVQKDVKRILGYSSIAHAGYILVAVLAYLKNPGIVHFSTVAYYLLGYCLMTVGAFAVVSLAAKGGKEGTRLEDLHGLWKRSPFVAGALILFAVSLIGIPPTVGFFGKLYIFLDALRSGLVPLAIVLAVNSVLSVAYYLSIARAVFVSDEEPARETARTGAGLAGAVAICGLGVLMAGIIGGPIVNWMDPSTANKPKTMQPSNLPKGSGNAMPAMPAMD